MSDKLEPTIVAGFVALAAVLGLALLANSSTVKNPQRFD
jgi:hypothetical protein